MKFCCKASWLSPCIDAALTPSSILPTQHLHDAPWIESLYRCHEDHCGVNGTMALGAGEAPNCQIWSPTPVSCGRTSSS